MVAFESVVTPKVTQALDAVMALTITERLLVARLLLDSVLVKTIDEEIDWQNLGLAAFEKDWDNEEDAIYDTWRDLYGVSTR